MLKVWDQVIRGEVFGEVNWPAEHRHFFHFQLLLVAVSSIAFPFWLFATGSISYLSAVVFGWLLCPLFAATLLIKTRSFDLALVVSSISLTGLICTLCVMTGGVQSFAVVWLLAVPFEAALSRRRSLVLFAMSLILLAAAFLMLIDETFAVVPHEYLLASEPLGFVLGPVAVIAYATISTMRILNVRQVDEIASLENEFRYRLMADNATDLIAKHDLSGKVLFASPSTRALLGIEPSEIEQMGLFERIHIADRPAYMRMMSDVNTLQTTVSTELRIRQNKIEKPETFGGNSDVQADFTYCWVEMQCRPVWGDNQEVQGIVSTTRDITERRLHEDELTEAHMELQSLNRAKSRFLANMSHELRTPLNAIIGFSELIDHECRQKADDRAHRDYAGHIHEAGVHLLQVVTDVLDVSKIESGTFDIIPEPYDIANLVHGVANILSQEAAARQIKLKVVLPANLPEAVADPRACRQILINLVSNALKFSDNGDEVVLGARIDGDHVAYFVRDEGIGVTKDELQKIGQPFFQADSGLGRKFEGTGLGLSIVKGLTELHQGRVKFESEPGKGLQATIYIPLDCETASTNIERLEPVRSSDSESKEPKVEPTQIAVRL